MNLSDLTVHGKLKQYGSEESGLSSLLAGGENHFTGQ